MIWVITKRWGQLRQAQSMIGSWASLIAQLVKNPPPMQETPVQLLDHEGPSGRDRLPTPVFLGFPCGSDGKESACNAGNLGWENPLEKGTATHSSVMAFRIPRAI